MLYKKITTLFLLLLMFEADAQQTTNIQPTLNFQGVTGLIQIPTADTILEGQFQISTANFIDGIYQNKYDFGPGNFQSGHSNHILFSPIENLEVSVRNVGVKFSEFSDLSANVKYRLPILTSYGIDIALGATDVAGMADYFDGYYGVITKNFDGLSISAGIGSYSPRDNKKTSIAPRFNNGFIGAHYQALDWLGLMLEYDGVNSAAGLTLTTPKHWRNSEWSVYGKFIVHDDYSRMNENKVDFLIGVTGSLYSSTRTKNKQSSNKPTLKAVHAIQNSSAMKASKPKIVANKKTAAAKKRPFVVPKTGYFNYLQKSLTKQGFDNIEVGDTDNDLIISFENNIFNRNDIDAIGIVLGIISQSNTNNYSNLILSLTHLELPVFRMKVAIESLVDFYQGNARLQFNSMPLASNNIQDNILVRSAKNAYFRPQVTLSPKLNKFMATEIGMYDYSLALNTEVRLPLFYGTELNMSYDLELAHSEEFGYGKPFSKFRIDNGIKKLLLRHSQNFTDRVFVSAALGRYKDQINQSYDVVFTEVNLPFAEHNIGLHVGYASHTEIAFDKQLITARYRYYSRRFDADVTAEVGQFWQQDQGIKLGLQKHYGDTRLKLFYQKTDRQLAGLEITVPLSPRQDHTPKYWGQIRGNEGWSYTTQTVVKRVADGGNNLSVQRAYIPKELQYIPKVLMNDDRLHYSYVLTNQQRLRDAFNKYVKR